jgi:hypothetical protein
MTFRGETLAPEVAANYGKLPLHFEPNQGQVDGRVRYLTRLPEMTIYLADDEAVFQWRKTEPPEHRGSQAKGSDTRPRRRPWSDEADRSG